MRTTALLLTCALLGLGIPATAQETQGNNSFVSTLSHAGLSITDIADVNSTINHGSIEDWKDDLVLILLKPDANGSLPAEPVIWIGHHLQRNKVTRLQVVYPSNYPTPSAKFEDKNYGPSSIPQLGGGGGAPDRNGVTYRRAIWEYTPTGDDLKIDITFAPQAGGGNGSGPAVITSGAGGEQSGGAPGVVTAPADNQTNLPATPPAPTPYTFTRTLPVDFIGIPKIAFSVGLLGSNLHDDSVVLVPNSADSTNQTSVVTSGAGSGNMPKAIGLIHFSVIKARDSMFGPCIGILQGSTTGYFLGGSYLFGKSDRLALSVGREFSKVNRLSGYSYGQVVPNGTTTTQQVTRESGWEVALTYAFGSH